MSVISLATTNVAAPIVTMKDIAAKTGYSFTTVSKCMHAKSSLKYKQSTVDTIRNTAKEMGYDARLARSRRIKTGPANSVFASRDAETNAMVQLRKSGHSDKEVAHRCGVCSTTVVKRIGRQPAEITAANKKLAGQVRSAKAKIKKAYQHQQTIKEYNALAARLNAHMLEVQKMQTSLNDMQKKANIASKATNVPLLRLLPNTKVC